MKSVGRFGSERGAYWMPNTQKGMWDRELVGVPVVGKWFWKLKSECVCTIPERFLFSCIWLNKEYRVLGSTGIDASISLASSRKLRHGSSRNNHHMELSSCLCLFPSASHDGGVLMYQNMQQQENICWGPAVCQANQSTKKIPHVDCVPNTGDSVIRLCPSPREVYNLVHKMDSKQVK